MKPVRNSGFGRLFKKAPGAGQGIQRNPADERKEALVLLAIAVLFVANVVLYLCHHYGFTSLNDWRPHTTVAARVLTD